MTTQTEEKFTNFLNAIKGLGLNQRPSLAPISYFIMGYACKARFETSKNLSTVIEAFYMLKRLEDLQNFDQSWKKKVYVSILKTPTMKVEKELNSLLTHSSVTGEEVDQENPEEENQEANLYDLIEATIANRTEYLDMILLGSICVGNSDLFAKIFEKATFIHEKRATEQFTEDQIGQLFQALSCNIETDLGALVTTIKESTKVEAQPVEIVNESPEQQASQENITAVVVNEREFECKICLETSTEATKFYPIRVCSHTFHKDCLTEYLKTQMADQKLPVFCPENDCKAEFSDYDLRAVLSNEEVKKFYDMTIAHYISKNRLVVFQCPTPDCTYKLFEFDPTATEVGCPLCFRITCLKCQEEVHYDTPCELNQFVKVAENLGLKACPSCRLWVEKDEGCNHMTCNCGHEFCYACGKVYVGLIEEPDVYSECAQGICVESGYYETMTDLLKLQEGEV